MCRYGKNARVVPAGTKDEVGWDRVRGENRRGGVVEGEERHGVVVCVRVDPWGNRG